MTKTLRERYLDNEILLLGEIVKDQTTGEDVKILDRGSNYVTVESSSGIHKKWIQDVISEAPSVNQPEAVNEDFVLLETGQIRLFGYDTKNFDQFLSSFIIEQFSEFTDLYSKHQIIKLLDSALVQTDVNVKFELLEKVSSFYKKQSVQEPLIIEGFKSEIERMRLSQIIATVAGTPITSNSYKNIKDAVIELRKKYVEKKQWQVLWPFFVLVNNAGFAGILNTLPYRFDSPKIDNSIYTKPYDVKMTESIMQEMESSVDEIAESVKLEDIIQTFSADELKYGPEEIQEAMKTTPCILTHSDNTSIISDRAKRLADTLVKRYLFLNSPDMLTQEEKDHFDSISNRTKLLTAKLSLRLIPKLKELQA